MKKISVILIIYIFITAVAFAQSASDVLGSLKSIKSYTADFVQTTEIEGFGEDEYSGKLYIMSGEKAFWDYEKPYRQFYLFDKSTMSYYDSETKQMIVQKLDPATNVFMRLMLSPADIEKDFHAELSGGELLLTPKKDIGIAAIVFVIKNGMVTGIKTKDQNGNNTSIELKNIVSGEKLDAKIFEPEIPEGTEVFQY